MKAILEDLGFSEKEATTYLTLLEQPNSSATTLAKYLPYDRRTVYDLMSTLFQKGYVSQYQENNITKYKVMPPQVLLKEADEKRQKIKELIPLLESVGGRGSTNQQVSVFKGRKGFIAILDEILQRKVHHYAFGAIEAITKTTQALINDYLQAYDEANLSEQIIFEEGYVFTPMKKGTYRTLARYMVPPTAVIMYDDIVTLFLNDGEETIVRMQSKEIATAYKSYFDVYWKMATPVRIKSKSSLEESTKDET